MAPQGLLMAHRGGFRVALFVCRTVMLVTAQWPSGSNMYTI